MEKKFYFVVLVTTFIYLAWSTEALKIAQIYTNNSRPDEIQAVVSDVESMLNKIPVEKRKEFIKASFAAALLQKFKTQSPWLSNKLTEEILANHVSEFKGNNKELDVKEGMSLKILEIAQAEYQLDDKSIQDYVVFNTVCFPNGCVDPGDIGSICCPFAVEIN